MPIAGSEGRHLYTSPDGSTFTFGLVKSDAGAQTLPRARIRTVAGLRSLSDAQDIADPVVGSFGEVPRTSHRAGKTVTYTGVIEALSLADFETVADAMRQAMANESQDGLMTVSWHPLYSAGSTAKVYPARALGLEIGDPIETTDKVSGTFVAAFRNHDGRYFEVTETSIALAVTSTTGVFHWPTATFPTTMQGPVNDIVTNYCTNPSAVGLVTTGWAATGANVTSFAPANLATSLIYSELFDPPAVTAFSVVTNSSAVAGDGAEFTRAVTSGSPVRFKAWIRNRQSSPAAVELRIYDAGGTLKATSSSSIAPDGGWAPIDVTVTPDSTGNWKFRVCQHAGGATQWAFTQVRICPAVGITFNPGYGPRINFPTTWDGTTLHLDFEKLTALDDAGHDYSDLLFTATGIWSRNPFSPGSLSMDATATPFSGPSIDPGISMTLRWTKAYW